MSLICNIIKQLCDAIVAPHFPIAAAEIKPQPSFLLVLLLWPRCLVSQCSKEDFRLKVTELIAAQLLSFYRQLFSLASSDVCSDGRLSSCVTFVLWLSVWSWGSGEGAVELVIMLHLALGLGLVFMVLLEVGRSVWACLYLDGTKKLIIYKINPMVCEL